MGNRINILDNFCTTLLKLHSCFYELTYIRISNNWIFFAASVCLFFYMLVREQQVSKNLGPNNTLGDEV